MHDYSIDRHPKEKVLYVLAFLAITVAPFLNTLAQQFATYLEVSVGWSSPPLTAIPVFGLFILLYMLFDRYLWKVEWLRRFLLVPDLNGKWSCTGRTTMKRGVPAANEWVGTVTITQSWSKIRIHLKTQSSEAKSISASLFHEVGVGYRLLYEYNNNPNADQLELRKHSGSAELLFTEKCDSADGHYFTDQHRQTVGTMILNKE